MPVLYDAEWAPSPRRVRIFLAEKGIEVETERLDMRTGEHLQPAYLEKNPRGTVPALRLDNGEVIGDSVGICRYFEALQPDPRLFGGDAREIGLVEAWTRRIEANGYEAVPLVLRNGVERFADRALPGSWPCPVPQIPALVERGHLMWRCFLDMLEAHLDGRAFVALDRITFADISALVAIDFGLAIKLEPIGERGNLARWHAAMSERPSAKA